MLKIITDSSSNISQAEAKQMGIEVLPLGIIFGEEEFLDGVDIMPEEFYLKLIAAKENYPHTSMLNMDLIEKTYKKAQQNGDTVFLITLSSKLSGTHDCANLVKNTGNYNNVFVYDSLGASAKVRVLVDVAVQNADKTPDELIKILDACRNKIELFAGVETLDYLQKGGRLSKGGAIIGNMLSVKPLVTVTNTGEIHVRAKSIGFNNALKTIKKITSEYEIDTNYSVYFLYSHITENGKKLMNMFPELTKAKMLNLSPVVGCHIGTGIAGICFVKK